MFVIEEKVLLNLFYCAPNFLLIFTSAPKNQSKRGALFSEGGGGLMGEYETGKEYITVYSLQQTRLHPHISFILFPITAENKVA